MSLIMPALSVNRLDKSKVFTILGFQESRSEVREFGGSV